jgi:hypothetical protein
MRGLTGSPSISHRTPAYGTGAAGGMRVQCARSAIAAGGVEATARDIRVIY